ncbi:MAG: WD40-repeat-containing domain protein [Olpidium bornovanus]|uniref:WD40-repeat-containing domain protein n=1 Tax=Olpidium bornovanus TaxID=278681 RepID=A0A8H8DGS3_9FUNG|nr:MAG: WD40-repeat-containing domain protein [Olpidium bornovanus]
MPEPVYAMHIHPLDEHLVASGGGDDKMYLWRSDTGDTVRVFGGHADSVVSVKFSANGEFVASGGMDGKVLVYRSATGELAVELEGPDEVVVSWERSLAHFVFSPVREHWSSPKSFFSSHATPLAVDRLAPEREHPPRRLFRRDDLDVVRYDSLLLPSATCPKVFSGHSGPVSAGRFTPDGKKIVSVSEDSSFVLWDPKTASALLRLSGEDARFHTGSITCVAVNRESTLAITGSEDGTARLINLQSGVILAALDNHSASIESVGFCDTCVSLAQGVSLSAANCDSMPCLTIPLVATAGVDGQVSIWDVQTFALRIVLTGHADAVTQLAWHRLSPVLTTCSADGTVLTWDARSGECVSKQGGHFGAVLSLGVTADGRRAISGGDDGVCLVFDLLQ